MEIDVSVIIPVHNAKNTLEKAVSSLLAGKDIHLEIILVENASTDGSIRLCWKLEHEHDNVRLFSTRQKGVSHARNIGMQNAKGRYVGFLDADDYADGHMYQELYREAVSHEADLAICGYIIERKHQDAVQVPDLSQIKKICEDKDRQVLPYDLLLAMMGKENADDAMLMGSVWRNIYKAEFLKRAAIQFSGDLEIGEDLLFNVEVLKRAEKVSVCDRMLYHYCQTGSSVTSKIEPGTWQKYEKLLEALIQFGEREQETGAFWIRYNSKVQMFSSWIAGEYARAGIPLLERCRHTARIRRARQRLFRLQYPVPGVHKISHMAEINWQIKILLRGTLSRIKRRLSGLCSKFTHLLRESSKDT